MRFYCANCPVRIGECPHCGTFWIDAHVAAGGAPGKRYGVHPVDSNPVIASGRDTTKPGFLETLGNVVERRAGGLSVSTG